MCVCVKSLSFLQVHTEQPFLGLFSRLWFCSVLLVRRLQETERASLPHQGVVSFSRAPPLSGPTEPEAKSSDGLTAYDMSMRGGATGWGARLGRPL